MSDSSLKSEMRAAAHQARRDQADKDQVSKLITDRLCAMPQYESADCVMWYLDVRDEVRTHEVLFGQLQQSRRLVIPYCVGDELQLFELRKSTELAEGRFGILEPTPELRCDTGRSVKPCELDLAVVPGLAFDQFGGRLGHGKGFYDRCLAETRSDVVTVGLAFECQVVTKVPMDEHDVAMDWVVTERRCLQSGGRACP